MCPRGMSATSLAFVYHSNCRPLVFVKVTNRPTPNDRWSQTPTHRHTHTHTIHIISKNTHPTKLNKLQVKIDQLHNARQGWGIRQNLLLELMKRVEKESNFGETSRKRFAEQRMRRNNPHAMVFTLAVWRREHRTVVWFWFASLTRACKTLKRMWWWDEAFKNLAQKQNITLRAPRT